MFKDQSCGSTFRCYFEILVHCLARQSEGKSVENTELCCEQMSFDLA